MEKKLYRSRKDRKLVGVCAGLANYFALDPVLVRVLWAVISIFYGAGILAYIVCAFLIPEEPDYIEGQKVD